MVNIRLAPPALMSLIFITACQPPPVAPSARSSQAQSQEATAVSNAPPNSTNAANSAASSSANTPSSPQVIPVPAAPTPPPLQAEWRFQGNSRSRLLGNNSNFEGYLRLDTNNRFLSDGGLTYRVSNSPWQNEAGAPVDGPSDLPQTWSVSVYRTQNGQRFGFPVAQTQYEGDFNEIFWNGVSDEGVRASTSSYEIVAIPEGMKQQPFQDPLQLLNTPIPDADAAPPPEYATEYLLARFKDLEAARQNYDIESTDAGVSKIRVSGSTDSRAEALLTLSQKLQQDSNVSFAEPDLFYGVNWVPNDPMRTEQYALSRVQAEAAWDIERGSEEVVIAIVDTGVDTNHPDLRSRMVPGWNTISENNNTRDDNGHGTHCAGIAAATGDNNTGIVGLAPEVKIMPLKVMDAAGRGRSSDIAEGIRWAVDQGADVISLSLGTTMGSTVIRESLVYAVDRGVSLVAAMGNDGGQVRNYPATYAPEIRGLIAVGATDAQDTRAYFSNYGNWITVTAPGHQILSTLPGYAVQGNRSGNPYGQYSGTSMATPYVAGLAGLLKSQESQRTAGDIEAAIIQGADDLGNTGFDAHFGHGRINAVRSLALNLPVTLPTPTPIPTPAPTSAPASGLPGGLVLDID